jgi:hypothetical protein
VLPEKYAEYVCYTESRRKPTSSLVRMNPTMSVKPAIVRMDGVGYGFNSLGKTGVGLGSPSAKSNPAQVRLGCEVESGRWHGL